MESKRCEKSGVSRIVARLATRLDGSNTVFVPVGSHDISATIDGEPGKATVHVNSDEGQAVVDKLNADLAERKKANVEPWLDFNHEEKAASGHPVKFEWNPDEGIILRTEWTAAGKAAIEGKDYQYFSPTVQIDDAGKIVGLLPSGSIGALVNEPAFRAMRKVAAAHKDHPNPQPTEDKMKRLLAKLHIRAEAENAEDAALDAVQALQNKLDALQVEIDALKQGNADLTAENEAGKKELESVKEELTQKLEDEAEALVKEAIEDGRIAPKDEALQAQFKAKLKAKDAFAKSVLASLPKMAQPGTSGKIVDASKTEDKRTPREKLVARLQGKFVKTK